MKRIYIGLGSTNPLKEISLLVACRILGYAAVITKSDRPSGVSPQPFGEEETSRGARNRSENGRQLLGENGQPVQLGIGIENGLRPAESDCLDQQYGDWAVIDLVSQDNVHFLAHSEEVRAYTTVMDEVLAARGALTAGEATHARHPDIPANDPHLYWSMGERTRVDILVKALLRALPGAIQHIENTMTLEEERTHTVHIGDRDYVLPIRPVSPELSLAIFSLRGNREATRHCAQLLAARLRSRFCDEFTPDVLLMPDGKATDLLEAVSLVSGIPGVIAAKKDGPALAKPVLSATGSSVTTLGIQRYYIGSEQIQKLAGKRILVLDDVVSTGGSLRAMQELTSLVGGNYLGCLAVLREGDAAIRAGILRIETLASIPLFPTIT